MAPYTIFQILSKLRLGSGFDFPKNLMTYLVSRIIVIAYKFDGKMEYMNDNSAYRVKKSNPFLFFSVVIFILFLVGGFPQIMPISHEIFAHFAHIFW